MKKSELKFGIPASAVLIIMIAAAAVAQNGGPAPQEKSLSSIAVSIEEYRDKKVLLTLKLKNVDSVFDTITFYDANNHDITFDISSKEDKKRFEDSLLNVHEGMDYRVEFTVKGLGNLKLLIGQLEAFEPVLLERIPEERGNLLK